jgi:hypothetical protein
VRVAVSTFIIGLPLLIVVREWLEALMKAPLAPDARRGFLVVESALLVGTALAVAHAVRWARARGASWPDAFRLLFGSTAPSRGWDAPRLSAMLAAHAGEVSPPRADDALDHVRAVADLAGLVPASLAELARDAERATRDLAARIEAMDAEIAALSRHGSAGELDRLIAQLGALASTRDTAERRELADLLRSQIDVVQRMQVRCELLTRQRAQTFELVRALWRRLALVRDAAAHSGDVPLAQAEQLRTVLHEVEELE